MRGHSPPPHGEGEGITASKGSVREGKGGKGSLPFMKRVREGGEGIIALLEGSVREGEKGGEGIIAPPHGVRERVRESMPPQGGLREKRGKGEESLLPLEYVKEGEKMRGSFPPPMVRG